MEVILVTEIASCRGKRIFRSWGEAERARKKMNKKYSNCRFGQYMCKYCEHWHIAERTKKEIK